MELLHTKPGY